MELVFVVAAVAIIGASVLAHLYRDKDRRTKREMQSVAVVAIRDAKEGARVRLVGSAEGRTTLAAPLSRRPCVYYRVVVEVDRGGGDSSDWRTLVEEEDGVELVVSDGTGKAIVKPRQTRALLVQDARYSSGFLNDATPRLEGFLQQHGLSSEGLVFNKTLRYREGIVEPGERVAVVGVCRWEPDPDVPPTAGAGYREASHAMRVVLEPPPDDMVLLSDELEVTGGAGR